MATSAAPTAALRQRRPQWQGQLGGAGAGEAEGVPCVSSSSLLATGPRTQASVLRLIVAAAPPAPRAKESPIPARSATCRSGRTPRSAPAPRRAQPQRGPGPEPHAIAVRGGGRAGGGAAGAAFLGAIPQSSTRRCRATSPAAR